MQQGMLVMMVALLFEVPSLSAMNTIAQSKGSTVGSLGRVSPDHTLVAILPVMNLSGEKDDTQRERQRMKGDEELAKEFADRGFRVVDQQAIKNALTELKIDLSDEEQQKRDALFRVGKTTGANLVVFAVITHVEQHMRTSVLNSSREGKSQVKLWLLDIDNQRPILSAAVREGKSGGGFFAGLDKGSDRMVIAVANAIRDHLKSFLRSYPVKK